MSAMFQQGGDPVRGHFQVELEAEDAALVEECLVVAGGTGREEFRPGRQGEGIAMPLEHGLLRGQKRKAGPRGGMPIDGHPTDFFFGVTVDPASQDFGEKLGTETDADHRPFQIDNGAEECFLHPQPWMGVFVMNAHGAAHHRQQVDPGGIGRDFTEIEPGDGYHTSALCGPTGQKARTFEGDMLEDVQTTRGHGGN